MDTEPDIIRKVKAAMGPYSKSREEVSYIRRVLTLYLQHQHETDSLPSPLSLLGTTNKIRQPPRGISHKGIYEQYFRAMSDNLKARQHYEEVRHGTNPRSTPEHDESKDDPLADHLAQMRLRKKQEKLLILQKYVERLSVQPVASQETSLEELFKDGPTLPNVPQEVLDSFSEAETLGGDGLASVLDQMERVVLRTKLLLRREEELLADARTRSEHVSQSAPNHARLHALSETRNELINWIEAELGKAAGDDSVGGAGVGQQPDIDITRHVEIIKSKYAEYTKAREGLLRLVSEKPQPTLQPSLAMPAHTQTAAEQAPAPTAHLAIPYIERLLELSRKQKGMIQHKSHLTASLSQQAKETRQMLTHLTEESQLLPVHPMPGAKKGKFGETMGAEKPDASRQVQPWVFAADSAKIATLEAVAEKVEEGQLALEGSMKALFEIDQLLGKNLARDETGVEVQQGEEDIWLAEESTRAPRPPTRGHRRQPSKPAVANDPWSALNGSLGLIGEDSPRR